MKNFELVECCDCGYTDYLSEMQVTSDGLHLCNYCVRKAEAARICYEYELMDVEGGMEQ